MELEELDLIKKCQSGQIENFSQIYENYFEKIYNFIYYRVSHKETAEDLTSLTFFKALEKINDFNIELGYFSAWIYRIARNNIIDHYRKDKKDVNIDDHKDLSNKEDIAYHVDLKYDSERIKEYLKDFSQEQKDIFMMRIWDNLSYREISKVIGKTEENCKVIFSRILSKIRKESLILSLLVMLKLFTNIWK